MLRPKEWDVTAQATIILFWTRYFKDGIVWSFLAYVLTHLMSMYVWTLSFDANELQLKLLEQQKKEVCDPQVGDTPPCPKQEPVATDEFPKQVTNDHKLRENMQSKLKVYEESTKDGDNDRDDDVCSESSDSTLTSSSSSSILTSGRVENRAFKNSIENTRSHVWLICCNRVLLAITKRN